MIGRAAFLALLLALGSARPALAQTPPDPQLPPLPRSETLPEHTSGPSLVMQSLYATTIVVQALDAHSTFAALDAGAIEKNPLLRPFATHRPAFIALKAAIAATAMIAGNRLSQHHKVRAVATLIAINAVYATIAARNYRIVREMRAGIDR